MWDKQKNELRKLESSFLVIKLNSSAKKEERLKKLYGSSKVHNTFFPVYRSASKERMNIRPNLINILRLFYPIQMLVHFGVCNFSGLIISFQKIFVNWFILVWKKEPVGFWAYWGNRYKAKASLLLADSSERQSGFLGVFDERERERERVCWKVRNLMCVTDSINLKSLKYENYFNHWICYK